MGDYDDEDCPPNMTETEKAIWKKKQAQKAQDEEDIREFLIQRQEEKERLDSELSDLLERQAQRRAEREENERTMEEMRRRQEEQRKQDDEERKAKQEAEKRKKEADRKRKQAMMAGGGIGGMMAGKGDGKPNFVLPNKEGQEEKKAGPKIDPGMTKEDIAAMKATYMERFLQPFEGEDMECSELRMRIKGMHENIAKLEAAKYDMEERQKIQDYDLKELRERAKQQARQAAIKKGLDPNEYANAKHPPKKAVASKYDRQIDRRSYTDRTVMFKDSLRMDGKPIIAPPKAIFHGTCRPPPEFSRPATKLEELEVLRKTMEPPKYQEAAPIEGAKPPVKPIKSAAVPGDDEIGPAPPSLEGMAAAYVIGAPAAAEAAPAAAAPPPAAEKK